MTPKRKPQHTFPSDGAERIVFVLFGLSSAKAMTTPAACAVKRFKYKWLAATLGKCMLSR